MGTRVNITLPLAETDAVQLQGRNHGAPTEGSNNMVLVVDDEPEVRAVTVRILRENGLSVEALIELRAPEGASKHEYYDTVDVEWARRWPAEEIWKARKTG